MQWQELPQCLWKIGVLMIFAGFILALTSILLGHLLRNP